MVPHQNGSNIQWCRRLTQTHARSAHANGERHQDRHFPALYKIMCRTIRQVYQVQTKFFRWYQVRASELQGSERHSGRCAPGVHCVDKSKLLCLSLEAPLQAGKVKVSHCQGTPCMPRFKVCHSLLHCCVGRFLKSHHALIMVCFSSVHLSQHHLVQGC